MHVPGPIHLAIAARGRARAFVLGAAAMLCPGVSLPTLGILFFVLQVFWAVTAPPVLAQDTAKSPLVVMGDKSYPPYESLVDGEPVGINVELWREIGRILGRPVDLRLYQWADSQARVRRGEAKVLTFMSVNKERQKLYDFTQPTFTSKFPYFVIARTADQFDVYDLIGKRIAVKRGGFPESVLLTVHPEAVLVFVDSALEGFQKLLRGEVDAVVEEERVGYAILRENNLKGIRVTSGALAVKSGHIVVVKGNPALLRQLDDALRAVKASGKFDQILDKWADKGSVLVSTETLKFIVVSGLAAIILMVGVGGALYVSRMRKVNFALKAEINERKRTEAALRESEERFRILIDGSSQGILVHRNLRTLYVNQSLVEMFGYDGADEILALESREVMTAPEERARLLGYHQARLRGDPAPVDYEFKGLRKDGSKIWLENRSFHIEWGGDSAICTTLFDVTERKRAEEALSGAKRQNEMLLEAAGEGIYGLDLQGRTTFINPAAARMIGWEPEDLIGRPQHDILHHTKPDGSPYPREECPIYAAFKDGQCHHVADEVFWRKDGTSFPVEYTSTPIRVEGGLVGAVVVFRDITERKQAEMALRESEERFRAVVDNSPTKIHIKDLDGRYTLINRQSEILFGVTNEEARGKTSRDIFPKEVADSFAGHDQAVIESGRTIENEEEWVLDDGVHTFLTVKFPILGATGKIVAVGAIGTDITERKQAEARNAALATAIDSLEENFTLYDKDDRLVMCNQRVRDFNRDIAETLELGASFEDLVRAIADKGLAPAAKGREKEWIKERIALHRNPGEPFEIERQNGMWLLINEQRLPDGSTATISTHITELKRTEGALRASEDRFRSVIDNSPSIITLKDADGRIQLVNRKHVEMFGMEPPDVVGKSSFDLYPEKLAKGVTAHDRKVIETKSAITRERQISTKQGTRDFLVTKFPVLDGSGDVIRIGTIGTDITVRKRAEEEIRRLNASLEGRVARRTAELEAANKELEAFSYSVSHDLRAPLRTIDGFSRIILEEHAESLDDEGKNYFERVRAGSQKMGQLIDAVLQLSRLTRGDLKRKKLDLSKIVRSIVAELKESQPDRDMTFTVARGVTAAGDEQLIKMALQNMLGNAVKYTGKKNQARIEFGVTNGDGRNVYFVRDNGAGFDMSYADKLFAPFQRAHEAAEFEGTGIGLATVRRIINHHSGKVWAEAEVDNGATFFFTLSQDG